FRYPPMGEALHPPACPVCAKGRHRHPAANATFRAIGLSAGSPAEPQRWSRAPIAHRLAYAVTNPAARSPVLELIRPSEEPDCERSGSSRRRITSTRSANAPESRCLATVRFPETAIALAVLSSQRSRSWPEATKVEEVACICSPALIAVKKC